MAIELIVKKETHRFEEQGVMLHDTEIMSQEARAVLSFLEKWGMVAAEDAGEDSAGRARLRLLSEREVVDRAMSMARHAFADLRREGWLKPGLTWEEVEEVYAARKREREEQDKAARERARKEREDA